MSGFSGSGEGTSFLDDIPPPLTPENVSRFSHSQGLGLLFSPPRVVVVFVVVVVAVVVGLV